MMILTAGALLAGCGQQATLETTEAGADKLADAVSPAVLKASLTFLADDALGGRAPATRGGDIAAKYIAAEFLRLGLEPAGENETVYHRIPIISLTPSPTLQLHPTGRAAVPLAYRNQFVLWSELDQPDVSASAELVFVGFGIVAPEYDWNDYAGVDVQGKIVVALVNDPGLIDSTLFKGKALTYYGRWTYKIEEAARQGAAGIIMVHTTESATYPWAIVESSWTGPQVRLEKAATPLRMAGWITDEIFSRYLLPSNTSIADVFQEAATPGFHARPLPATATGRVRSTIRRSETVNVLARLTGWGPHPEEAVLIGGHYDHLGTGKPVDGDSIYNGAIDNASGVAGVIAAAEAFVRSGVHPDRSVIFMAFGAEESGLLGSKAFVERPTIPLKDLAAVFNLDELNLYGKTRDVSALGTEQSSLGRFFEEAARAEGLRVVTSREALESGYFFRSDQFPFVLKGVPALYLQFPTDYVGRDSTWGEQMIEDYTAHRYHQVTDEILPWYSMDGAVQQLRVIVRTALMAAEAAEQPTWNEGSEFKAAGEARLTGD